MVEVRDDIAVPTAVVPKRVALLTNILLSHSVAVFEALDPLVMHLRIFLSAVNEPERKMPIQWGNLDVVVQKSFSFTRHFTNVYGYKDSTHIHIPYDTLSQLWTYKPDVIVSNQLGGRTFFAMLYKMLRPATTFIVWATLSQRTQATRGWIRTLLQKLLLRRADACFAHGADGERYLRGLGYAGPVFFTPYVIESAPYEGGSLLPGDDVFRVLYAGQLIERKGIYTFTVALYDWCRRHPESRVLYQVGGEGPERARLEALAPPSNLSIEFLGHLDVNQLSRAYRSASIYAFPTLGDEWGMVVNEALSAGLPILASEHAQASVEMVEDGVNGWIFDPTDAASLSDGIERAMGTDRQTLDKMSRSAKKSAALWTPQVMAGRMASAIRSC